MTNKHIHGVDCGHVVHRAMRISQRSNAYKESLRREIQLIHWKRFGI